jgi:hypothetical protein
MDSFLAVVNLNKQATFKIEIDKIYHQSNGPNAYPIKFLVKKEKIWESDCFQCRDDDDDDDIVICIGF